MRNVSSWNRGSLFRNTHAAYTHTHTMKTSKQARKCCISLPPAHVRARNGLWFTKRTHFIAVIVAGDKIECKRFVLLCFVMLCCWLFSSSSYSSYFSFWWSRSWNIKTETLKRCNAMHLHLTIFKWNHSILTRSTVATTMAVAMQFQVYIR